MSIKRNLKTAITKTYWWIWFHVLIGENEFHSSLEIDEIKASKMNPSKRRKYYSNLAYKRNKAHEMDLAEKKIKLIIQENLNDVFFVLFCSMLLAITFTSIIYQQCGVRDGISIVLFDSFIVLTLIFIRIAKKSTKCCLFKN